MTLLAHDELIELTVRGVVMHATVDMVNSSSIDLTLGDKILSERGFPYHDYGGYKMPVLSLKNRDALNTKMHDLAIGPFYLRPGEFVLAQSRQVFNLPNDISAEYKLKSSMARIGLEHLNAGWCDAGWNGSVLTLELKNMTQNHTICLEKDVPIGQMVFFKHAPVPEERSYAVRGRYNNDTTVKGVKA